jgi:hypothetical protein
MFFYDLKEAVRHGRSTNELAELICGSPLLEKVRSARTSAAPNPNASPS